MKNPVLNHVKALSSDLANHPLYGKVNSMNRLQLFMQRHVYAVWDFMSLVKALQKELAPTTIPWTAPADARLARFINEVVVGEECDICPDGRVMSHFEMYCHAMAEIKTDSDLPLAFVSRVGETGWDSAMEELPLPASAVRFMQGTRSFLDSGKIHVIAAAFAWGREKVIPGMFQSLLERMNISEAQAPMFHFYLKRHIELDGDSHGPLADKMLEFLCGDDEVKWEEAFQAAHSALRNRMQFWDDVQTEIVTE